MRSTLTSWFAVCTLLVAGTTVPADELATSLDLSAPKAPDLSIPLNAKPLNAKPKRTASDTLPLLQPQAKKLLGKTTPQEATPANTLPGSVEAPDLDFNTTNAKPKLGRPQLVSPFLPGKLPDIYSPKTNLDLPIPPAPSAASTAKRRKTQISPKAKKPDVLELLPATEYPAEAAVPPAFGTPTMLPEIPFLRSKKISPPVGTGVINTDSAQNESSLLNAPSQILPPDATGQEEVSEQDLVRDELADKPASPFDLPQELPVMPPVASLRPNTSLGIAPGPDLTAVSEEELVSVKSPVVASPNALTSNLQVQQRSNPVIVANNNQIQFDNDLPQLRVSTVGPDTLMVGKSARYIITLNNKSNFGAREVEVRCTIPSWVKLDSHQTSTGTVRAGEPGAIWKLDGVTARGEQQLSLDLVPQAGKAFELNVDIAVQPSQSRKRIAIQEPMLAVSLQGPDEVAFNEPTTWQVLVENPGTGTAHDVRLEIYSGSRKLESKNIGTVAAGTTAVANLELSADDIGAYSLTAKAFSSTAASKDAVAEFVCRRGVLSIDVLGSEMDYVGSSTDYRVVLKNTGDAVSKNVLVDLEIPQGIRYQSGLPNPTITAGGVSWIVDKLEAGQEKSFPLAMTIVKPGDHQLRATASSADQQTAENSLVTESLTSADLKLIVTDPSGPRPINTVHEYTIDLTNRGSESARNISIIAVCPPEVEPVDVTGNAAIKSGQIFFKPILDLPPDHKVSFKVFARAKRPGHHAFRVIVKCYEPDLRLASEESTSYFDRSGTTKGRDVITRRSKVSPGSRKPEIVTQREAIGSDF